MSERGNTCILPVQMQMNFLFDSRSPYMLFNNLFPLDSGRGNALERTLEKECESNNQLIIDGLDYT